MNGPLVGGWCYTVVPWLLKQGLGLVSRKEMDMSLIQIKISKLLRANTETLTPEINLRNESFQIRQILDPSTQDMS